MEFDKDLRSIQEVRDLLTQAKRAQNALADMSQEDLDCLSQLAKLQKNAR